MNKDILKVIMRLGGEEIQVLRHEAFKKKALIVIPAEQELSFLEILQLFENSDLSHIPFYNKMYEDPTTEEFKYELEGEINGCSKLSSYNNNAESGLYTFQLAKPSAEEQMEELLNSGVFDQMTYAMSAVVMTFSDEQALNCIELFPEYQIGYSYKKDDRFKYEGNLYKVIQDHTSQEDWKPDTTKSLYVNVADPAIEFPDFVKPTGAHDAYMKGDKVTFEGKHYISKADNNVYSPSEYPANWELVD